MYALYDIKLPVLKGLDDNWGNCLFKKKLFDMFDMNF